MNKYGITILFALAFLPNSHIAAKIIQCVQPNGTIEFTNQGCAKSNTKKSASYSNQQTNFIRIKKTTHKKRSSSPFLQTNFVLLQKKLIRSNSLSELEQYAQSITLQVQKHLQNGKLKSAFDMIAATYVKLSKHLKKKHWQGQELNPNTLKMQALFEEILISQSTITNKQELSQIIEDAWQNYQSDS